MRPSIPFEGCGEVRVDGPTVVVRRVNLLPDVTAAGEPATVSDEPAGAYCFRGWMVVR